MKPGGRWFTGFCFTATPRFFMKDPKQPEQPEPVPGMDGGALMYGDYRKGLPETPNEPKTVYGVGNTFVTYANRPLQELVADREAIRAELKASRKRHTVRVRQHILP